MLNWPNVFPFCGFQRGINAPRKMVIFRRPAPFQAVPARGPRQMMETIGFLGNLQGVWTFLDLFGQTQRSNLNPINVISMNKTWFLWWWILSMGRLIMHVQFTPKYQYRWMLKLKFTVSSPRGWSIEDYTVSQAWNDPHHVGAQNSSTWPPHQPPSDADSAKIHPLFVVLTGSIHPGGQPPPEWPDPGWTSAPQRISWASDFQRWQMMSMISEATKIYDRYNPFPPSMSPKGRIFPQKKSHHLSWNRPLVDLPPIFVPYFPGQTQQKPCVFRAPRQEITVCNCCERFGDSPRNLRNRGFFFSVPGGETETATKVGMSIILWGHTYIISYIYVLLYIYIIICIYMYNYVYIYVLIYIMGYIYIYIIRTMTFWECLRKVDRSQFMAGILSMGYHPVRGLPNHGYSVL